LGVGAYLTALTYPEQERYQSYNDARTNQDGAAATAANLSSTPQNRTPCVNPKSETESDLCAQWRAARAAEKAADWTLWGVIASIIGIACLLWQIILTRKAVEDTGHATTAMVEANKIAKWHRTLRCYQFDKKGSLIRRDETLLHASDLGLTPFSGFIAT
jgi:hypothetical protein